MPARPDDEGRRLALAGQADERVRDGELVGHDEALGVEARLAAREIPREARCRAPS